MGSGEAGVGQRNCDYGWDGPAVGAALAAAERSIPAVVELARRVAEIPAPTRKPSARSFDAAWVVNPNRLSRNCSPG